MPDSKDPLNPIVGAVLADPIVKAVLKDPSAATTRAVEAASSGGHEKPTEAQPAPTSPPAENAPMTTSRGTTTTSQTAGIMTLPSGEVVAIPTSTQEEDRGTAGQREVNLMWETTQARISVAVVYCVLIVAGVLSVTAMLPWATEKQVALAITAFMLLSSLSTLVIGFYFGRSNHTKVGGVQQGR